MGCLWYLVLTTKLLLSYICFDWLSIVLEFTPKSLLSFIGSDRLFIILVLTLNYCCHTYALIGSPWYRYLPLNYYCHTYALMGCSSYWYLPLNCYCHTYALTGCPSSWMTPVSGTHLRVPDLLLLLLHLNRSSLNKKCSPVSHSINKKSKYFHLSVCVALNPNVTQKHSQRVDCLRY